MPDALLTAHGVRAAYGPVVALHGIDFAIGSGEIVVILGANGAGKTTTMRAICGTVATKGSIRLEGRELVGARPEQVARFGVAHVPQGRGTFADLSVEDNLEAGAYIRRDRAEVRADIERWYETFAVLGQRRHQPAGQLSGGEQQMLAIARALMCRPRLLLLDEPSLGLAPLVIRNLFEQLARINREEGTTMLVVEQNANLALGIAHRGYVLETGTLRAEGTAAELAADDTVRRARTWGSEHAVSLFLQRLFDAFENGANYASLALALSIIYKSTGHLNFAQGELAMVAAFVVYVLSGEQGWPVWLAVLVAVLASGVVGAGIERGLVRPLEKRNSLAVVIITLGLFLILNSVARDIWFGPPRAFVSPYPDKGDGGIDVGDATLYWSTITYWITVAIVFGLLVLMLRKTKIGLAFRAVSSNRESAQFVGISVGNTLMAGWALAAAVGAFAGIIAASKQGTIDANLMLPLLIYAFAAATLGGFDSLGGALVGGFLVALVETMAGGYIDRIGGELAQTTALALIIVVLLFRPTGLYGSRTVERG